MRALACKPHLKHPLLEVGLHLGVVALHLGQPVELLLDGVGALVLHLLDVLRLLLVAVLLVADLALLRQRLLLTSQPDDSARADAGR